MKQPARAICATGARRRFVSGALGFVLTLACGLAQAETMSGALARAYVASPALNQQRAAVRGVDENVPKAEAGWRPTITATGYVAPSYKYMRDAPPPRTPETRNPDAVNDVGNLLVYGQKYRAIARGYGVAATQTLFDGFKTLNSVRQAESQTFSAREALRGAEQDVLLAAATAYMDVLRDTALLALRADNVRVLEEQVRQTRSRATVGEATATDMAQAQASLAQARGDFFAARSNLQASSAAFRLAIGVEPKMLAPAKSVEALLPRHLALAVAASQTEHPGIAAALHDVDAAALAVKVAESALSPTATITAAASRDLSVGGVGGAKSFNIGVVGQINVPLYQGGGEYSSIRQAKEQLGQARLMADLQRDQIRAQVVAAWGQGEAAKAQILSGRATVEAAEVALKGVRGEALVGQRTTFDILTAQQTLLNARAALLMAQRDRVVASYVVLAAMGRLSAATLGLPAAIYDPAMHFDQVKGKLIGVQIPDGRSVRT